MSRTECFWKRTARAVAALGTVVFLLAAVPIILTAFAVRAVCAAMRSKETLVKTRLPRSSGGTRAADCVTLRFDRRVL